MNRPLLIIAGPTGAGKSALALRVAETFRGEIVNCDSLQLYRGLDIGTAKLPASERRGIPHHLFDVLEPSQGFSAGEYARQCSNRGHDDYKTRIEDSFPRHIYLR